MESKIVNLIELESRLVVTRGWRAGKMGRFSQKVQAISYKMSKFWRSIMYSMVNIVNMIVYLKYAKRVNLKSYHYTHKNGNCVR